MEARKVIRTGLLSVVFIFVILFSSAVQGYQPLNETRPEGIMADLLPRLPGVSDDEPLEPLPSAPEIIPWSKVVFQRYENGKYHIYTGNDDGTGQVQLTNSGANDLYPNFNRGATRIVFASNREPNTGDYDIYTMHVDGSNITQLTFNDGDDWNAEYSPDGSKIAFQSVVNNQSDVFIMNTDGTGLVNVTNHPDYDGAPSWSPDGTQLTFISRRTGGYRVYTMNANGTNVVQRSNQPYSNNPEWSPDGQRIAYDADIDNGSRVFPEIWMMDADGSNQTIIYKPLGATDALVSGWSPDGAFISYTRLDLALYNGTWYWDDAHINGVRWYDNTSQAQLSPVPLDWRPHWQTTEVTVPQSAVNPLPAQSGNPVEVSWSGSDSGQAGLKAFDIQVRKGQNGPWTDWLVYTTATSGSYSGVIGGETYYFRSRAWDQAHNLEAWPATPDAFTTIDSLAPVSSVDPLPTYTRESDQGFLVSWNGFDPGSGVANYDIQYRIGSGGWNNWLNATTLVGKYFTNGNIGQTIYFRSRARDTAQNLEIWPGGNGDTNTTLYHWGIRGRVFDNGHAPVSGASVTTNPSALGVVPSDLTGDFSAFVGSQASVYSAGLQKNGYGSLPLADFPGAYDASVDYILPPADDIVLDGGFESGVLGGPWIRSSGVITAVVAQDEGHTGSSHLQLGSPPPQFDTAFRVDAGGSDYYHSFPQLVTRDDGSTYIFWTEGDGVHYRWRYPDGSWSLDSKVGTSADNKLDPQVMQDSLGRIHLAWKSTNFNIYYARRNTNGNWTTPIILNTNTDGYYDTGLQMDLDSNNLPHLVWFTRVGQSPNVSYVHMYTHQLQNNIWSTPDAANDPIPGLAGTFTIEIDDRDNLHIVRGDNNGGSQFHYVLMNNQWSMEFQINKPGDQGGKPFIISDGSGGIKVIWDVYDPSASEGVYSRSWSEESGWLEQQKIGDGEVYGSFIDVENGPNGEIYVAWQSLDDKVFYVFQDQYGSWSSTELIGTFSDRASGVKLTADSNGRPHIVWTNDGNGKSQYSYQKADGTWVGPIELASSGSEYLTPNIVFDKADVLHIAYPRYIGRLFYKGQIVTDTADSVTVSQVLTIPVNMTSPVLSFMYQLGGAYDFPGDSSLLVELDDGNSSTEILDYTQSTGPHWTHGWSDLANWAGETVTLTFTLEQAADAPLTWARVDEVTVGSGYPDVWSTLGDGAGYPGQEVTLTLTYGNQGGVVASDVSITQTLPGGLTFVSASVSPVSTSPLVWDVGDLPAGSGPFTIMVTLKVSPSAPPLVYLTSSVDIAPAGQELETANNGSQGQVFTGVMVFMPAVFK